jgi:hydroxyacylglutathione hydrolase
VYFAQHYLDCLSQASYLIGDETTGRAVVVDPRRDVSEYLDDARARRLAIEAVINTHFHADFAAGHLELAAATGAWIGYGQRAAKVEYPVRRLADRERISLGDVTLEIRETPGHTPESISVLVYEHAADAVPYGVLTGDALFIGDVGRPDLRAALGWSAEQLASMLYDSLREKLLQLPDETLVYPAHGAGSLCGKNLSTDTVSTIGVQRSYNYALQPMSRERFVELVTTDQPDTPAYFTYDAVLNARERPTLEQALQRELQPLSLEEVEAGVADGAQLLDTRDAAEFEGAHLRGALNVGLGGSFATWCGTLLDPERPVVIVAEPGREHEAAMRLGRIGFDTVAGYLVDGMQQLDAAPELVDRTKRITAGSLAEQLASPSPPVLIDVRAPGEWAA